MPDNSPEKNNTNNELLVTSIESALKKAYQKEYAKLEVEGELRHIEKMNLLENAPTILKDAGIDMTGLTVEGRYGSKNYDTHPEDSASGGENYSDVTIRILKDGALIYEQKFEGLDPNYEY